MKTLRSFGWQAKPLQPRKGSQGKAWNAGAETEPPSNFSETQHGWVSVTKIKDSAPLPKTQGLIATLKTKQHIQGASASSSSTASDPWQQGPDPWSNFKPAKATAVPSQHVQSRFDDVESRLQEQVATTVTQEMRKHQQHPAVDSRLTAVENQIQSLVDNQNKIEHWVADSSAKVHSLQQDCTQLHQQVQSQGHTPQQVATDVSHCTSGIQAVSQEVSGLKDGLTSHLDAYFAKQQGAIEALLAKKPRHS